MNRLAISVLFFNVFLTVNLSQEIWTLDDCIDYALENNIQLKRQKLQSESARNNLNHSYLRVLPDLTAFANHDFNAGRALNYDTYQWENRKFEQGNLGMDSRFNVFSGFQNYNNIQQNRFLLMSRLEDAEYMINNITLGISAVYFQVLLDDELVEIAISQKEASAIELASIRKKFEMGNVSRGRVLELESQVAADEYNLTISKNNLGRSYLELANMMQLDSPAELKIARPEIIDIDKSAIMNTVDDIYSRAESVLPRIKGAEYFLKSREKELQVVRGQLSPRIYLRGVFYSRYSELALNPLGAGDYPYSDQIRDNQYRQLGISLSIPIFDSWNARTRINNARVSVMDAHYQLDARRQDLYSEIHQMHNDAVNAWNRYNSAMKAVAAAVEASDYAREQFGLGLISFVDYQYAQNNLLRSKSGMVQSKYEFYLRSKILDFYLGEPFRVN